MTCYISNGVPVPVIVLVHVTLFIHLTLDASCYIADYEDRAGVNTPPSPPLDNSSHHRPISLQGLLMKDAARTEIQNVQGTRESNRDVTEPLVHEIENHSTNTSFQDTCENNCGNAFGGDRCDCDPYCLVYKACCPDVTQFCPHITQEAEDRFEENLLDDRTTVVCSRISGMYMVSGCLNSSYNSSLGENLRELERKSSVYTYLLDYIPVTDNRTNVVYSNFHSYQCYRHPESKAMFWQLQAWAFDLKKGMGSVEDLVSSLEENLYSYEPPSDVDNSGQQCSSGDIRHVAPFAMLVNMQPDLNIDIDFIMTENKYFIWETISRMCVEAERGAIMCNGLACDAMARVDSGGCPRHMSGYFRFTHPSWSLSLEDLHHLASLLECAVKNGNKPIELNVTDIVPEVPPPRYGAAANENQTTSQSRRHFEISFNLKTPSDFEFDQYYLIAVLFEAYDCLGLILSVDSPSMFGQFIPRQHGSNKTRRVYRAYPGLSHLTPTSAHCSVHGWMYPYSNTSSNSSTVRSDTSLTNRGGEDPHYVGGCLGLTHGEKSQTAHEVTCKERFYTLEHFHQCVRQAYTYTDEGRSAVASRSWRSFSHLSSSIVIPASNILALLFIPLTTNRLVFVFV